MTTVAVERFKAGDRVVCVQPNTALVKGREYTVAANTDLDGTGGADELGYQDVFGCDRLELVGYNHDGFMSSRFERAEGGSTND